jgi:SHS2 domain-containing protein
MYEIFEHTADMGIRARADDPNELFAEAACGLFTVMVADVETIRPAETLTVRLVAEDFEELLHNWLSELLYLFHAKRYVFCDFHVQLEGLTLEAAVRGEPIDFARHEIAAEVKAITWHGLKMEKTPDGWLAEVVVDI